ncbi:carboxypeptidase-like regulatory domain-containing protein [Nannocystis sp. ILAH1]|uniref:carboxypeptidase-like regulatory domain-containing protein n=1 Tax=Nannocystis sp. ILAH1 TaxID=2996789 RepID=UPI00226E3DCC|nr:carboxypeptidase-like regulatory domain-containing protein [Nannocystis sp. ILAH1]MCY0986328.1 carboxypeptidase-like regulatory domain-containing protein [Nannocystis sp. ILAH1]
MVHDASGGEIEGAIVRAGGSTDFSGPDGTFVLHVRPGTHGVEALAEGYAPGGAWSHVPGQTVQILMLPEAVLVGRVVRAADGQPVAGARVVAKRGWPLAAVTDANGNFRVGQLRPGIFKPRVEADTYTGMAEAQVHVGIGETSSLVLVRVYPATSVRGKIVGPGGSSCEVGTVSLSERLTRRTAWGAVEADGEVAIRGLLPGTYEVGVHCEGYVSEDSYEAIVVGDAPIGGMTWRVKAGRAIRGKVVDAGGAAVLAETVSAQPVTASLRGTIPVSGPTGPDGSFSLAGLVPGSYELEVSPGPGRPQPPRRVVEVLADRDLEDVVIALPDGGVVQGRVIDSEGRPVARASMHLRGEQDGGQQECDDEGRFVLQGVAPGRYRATASIDFTPLKRPGQGPDELPGVWVEARLGSVTEVEIVVEGRGGRISGQVIDGSGGPIADAMLDWVREADIGGSAVSRMSVISPRQPTLSDGNGRFEISGLSPGFYTIRASRHDEPGEGRVEHVPVNGATVLTIPDTGEIGGSVRSVGGAVPEWVKVTAREADRRGWAEDEFFRTDGRFRLAGLAPGRYTVRAESGEAGAETTVTLLQGEVRRDIELVLAPR